MTELLLEAKLENMDIVLNFVEERLEGSPAKIRNQISIAVDEIFSNIARYAYHPDVGGATVRISVDDDITIEFEDSGIAYDPLSAEKPDITLPAEERALSAEKPDITLPAEEREVGGLGLLMVKNLMDSVEYRRAGNKNILTIKKKLAE